MTTRFVAHVATLPRRFPGPPAVATIGWLPNKQQRVQATFASWNYSFIVHGQGVYGVDGISRAVDAPMVITQRPEKHYDYGPQTSWAELFVIYDVQSVAPQSSFHGQLGDCWPILTPLLVRPVLDEIISICTSEQLDQAVDRLDRLCELAVIESLRPASYQHRGSLGQIEMIHELVQQHLHEALDFDQLAADASLSPTHFRRLWRQHYGLPPGRYVNEMRLRRACRDLVESTRPIGDIAAAVGFTDQLYFARCFRRFTGLSASDYRHRHRLTTGLHLLKGPGQTLT